MRLLSRFARLYDRFRFAVWAGSVLCSASVPLLSYAGSALGVLRRRMSMLSDDPEGASDVHVPDPLSWIGSAGWPQTVSRWVFAAGCIVLVLAVAGLVCSRLAGTRFSGVDGESAERERRDREGDEDEPVDVYD